MFLNLNIMYIYIFYFFVTGNSILMNIDNINNSDQPHDENMKDKDYEQADEVDDETTMEEEEALPELEDPLREIKFLQEVIYFFINIIILMSTMV